jgi:hypothetical protein
MFLPFALVLYSAQSRKEFYQDATRQRYSIPLGGNNKIDRRRKDSWSSPGQDEGHPLDTVEESKHDPSFCVIFDV